MAGRALIGICALVLLGGLAVTVATWLSHHRHVAVRVVGRGVALATAAFCGFVAFALVADNIGTRPRLIGAIVTAVFAAISVASVASAWHSVAVRRAATGAPATRSGTS